MPLAPRASIRETCYITRTQTAPMTMHLAAGEGCAASPGAILGRSSRCPSTAHFGVPQPCKKEQRAKSSALHFLSEHRHEPYSPCSHNTHLFSYQLFIPAQRCSNPSSSSPFTTQYAVSPQRPALGCAIIETCRANLAVKRCD